MDKHFGKIKKSRAIFQNEIPDPPFPNYHNTCTLLHNVPQYQCPQQGDKSAVHMQRFRLLVFLLVVHTNIRVLVVHHGTHANVVR